MSVSTRKSGGYDPATVLTGKETAQDAERMEMQALRLESTGQDLESLQLMEKALQIRCQECATGTVPPMYVINACEAAERLVTKSNAFGVKCFKSGDYATAETLLGYSIEMTEEGAFPLRESEDRRRYLRGVTLNNYGCMERRRGHFSEALEYMKHSMQCTGEQSPVAYLNISAVQTQLRLCDDAAGSAIQAIQLLGATPEDPSLLAVAHHNLAMALEPLDRTRALEEYQSALALAQTTIGSESETTMAISRNMTRFMFGHQRPRTGNRRESVAPSSAHSNRNRGTDVQGASVVDSSLLSSARPVTPQEEDPEIFPHPFTSSAAEIAEQPKANVTRMYQPSMLTRKSVIPPRAPRPMASDQMFSQVRSDRSARGTQQRHHSPTQTTRPAQPPPAAHAPRSTSRQVQQSIIPQPRPSSQISPQSRPSRLPPVRQARLQTTSSAAATAAVSPKPPRGAPVSTQSSSQARYSASALPPQSSRSPLKPIAPITSHHGTAATASSAAAVPTSRREMQAATVPTRQTTARHSSFEPAMTGTVPPRTSNRGASLLNSPSPAVTGASGAVRPQRGSVTTSTAASPQRTTKGSIASPTPKAATSPGKTARNSSGTLTHASSVQATSRAAAATTSAPRTKSPSNRASAANLGRHLQSTTGSSSVPGRGITPSPLVHRGSMKSPVKHTGRTSTSETLFTEEIPAAGAKTTRGQRSTTKSSPSANLVTYLTDRLDMLVVDEEELERKQACATIIQLAFRRQAAQKHLQTLREDRERYFKLREVRGKIAARTIQRHFRKIMQSKWGTARRQRRREYQAGERQKAALRIQSWARVWLTRRYCARRRFYESNSDHAALTVQKWWRCILARREFAERRRLHQVAKAMAVDTERSELAATIIQSRWRARAAERRTRVDRLRAAELRQKHLAARRRSAAERIQSWWRLLTAGAELRRLRELQAAREARIREHQRAIEAATKLQSFGRMIIAQRAAEPFLTRARVNAAKRIREQCKENRAAQCIQRAYRSHYSVRLIKRMRLARKDERYRLRMEKFLLVLQRIGRGYFIRRSLHDTLQRMEENAREYDRKLRSLMESDRKEEEKRQREELDVAEEHRRLIYLAKALEQEEEDERLALIEAETCALEDEQWRLDRLVDAVKLTDSTDGETIELLIESRRLKELREAIGIVEESPTEVEKPMKLDEVETAARIAAEELNKLLELQRSEEEAQAAIDKSNRFNKIDSLDTTAREISEEAIALETLASKEVLTEAVLSELDELRRLQEKEWISQSIHEEEVKLRELQEAEVGAEEIFAEAVKLKELQIMEDKTQREEVLQSQRASMNQTSPAVPQAVAASPMTNAIAEKAPGELELGGKESSLEIALRAARAERYQSMEAERQLRLARDALRANANAYRLRQIAAASTEQEVLRYVPRPPLTRRRIQDTAAQWGSSEESVPAPARRAIAAEAARSRAATTITRVARGHGDRRYVRTLQAISAMYNDIRVAYEQDEPPSLDMTLLHEQTARDVDGAARQRTVRLVVSVQSFARAVLSQRHGAFLRRRRESEKGPLQAFARLVRARLCLWRRQRAVRSYLDDAQRAEKAELAVTVAKVWVARRQMLKKAAAVAAKRDSDAAAETLLDGAALRVQRAFRAHLGRRCAAAHRDAKREYWSTVRAQDEEIAAVVVANANSADERAELWATIGRYECDAVDEETRALAEMSYCAEAIQRAVKQWLARRQLEERQCKARAERESQIQCENEEEEEEYGAKTAVTIPNRDADGDDSVKALIQLNFCAGAIQRTVKQWLARRQLEERQCKARAERESQIQCENEREEEEFDEKVIPIDAEDDKLREL